jgi:hypothetical protein
MDATIYAVLADVVLGLHFAFVLFVALGAFLVWRWPRVAWAHVPAAVWGALIEFSGGICPLTPLENALRLKAGEAGYTGDFIGRYVLALMYPEGLTRTAQVVLGSIVVIANVAIYVWVWRSRAKTSASLPPAAG